MKTTITLFNSGNFPEVIVNIIRRAYGTEITRGGYSSSPQGMSAHGFLKDNVFVCFAVSAGNLLSLVVENPSQDFLDAPHNGSAASVVALGMLADEVNFSADTDEDAEYSKALKAITSHASIWKEIQPDKPVVFVDDMLKGIPFFAKIFATYKIGW